MHHFTLLPIRNELWLCQRTDVGAVPVRPLPGVVVDDDGKRPPIAVNASGWVALADGAELTLLPPSLDAVPIVASLPDDLEKIGALNFLGPILYVGASSSWQDTSRLGWLDVTDAQPTFEPLPAPHVVGDTTRPIFGLLVSGDRLIALDAAFTPKLSIVYDIAAPRKARYIEHVAIPSGIDDQPVDACAGRSYVAILTRAQQDRGRAWKIGIFDFDTMDEIATFYEHANWDVPMEMPVAITMHEDLLLIAREMKGLGAVRLDDRRDTRYPNVPAISPWAQSYVPLERIEYQAPLGQGRVIGVQPTADPHVFAITVKRGGRTWWEEIVVT